MQAVKNLLNNNAFQSFIVAFLVWLADFIKSNATLTWESFAVAAVGFVGTYISTHQSVKVAVAEVSAPNEKPK